MRTETRTGYTCEKTICTPGEKKMVDNAKGHWPKMTRKKWKVDETLSDDLFSKTSLGR